MGGTVTLQRTADEVLGTTGQSDRAFLITTLIDARDLILSVMDASEANGEAQLDHIDDSIEMLGGVRPS